MSTPQCFGCLCRLDFDGTFYRILEGVNISNGRGFTPDRKFLYFEAGTRRIYILGYDEETGTLCNQQVWLQPPKDDGIPDGLTVDREGYIWSARWDGSAVYRYTPDGEVDRHNQWPAKKVTSMVFGGDDTGDLYITTALFNRTKEEGGSSAGGLFRVPPGIKGLLECLSRILI